MQKAYLLPLIVLVRVFGQTEISGFIFSQRDEGDRGSNLGCVNYSIREMTKFNVSRSCLR